MTTNQRELVKMNIEYKMFAGSDGTNPEPSNPNQHTPTDEEAKLLKEVMAKKETIAEQGRQLEAQNAKIAELEKSMQKIADMGGIEAFQSMISDKAEAEKQKLEEKGAWDKLRDQMVAEHTKATADMKAEIETLRGQVSAERAKIADLTVGTAFSDSKYLQEKTILTPSKARIIFGNYFDIGEDGSLKAFDKPRGADGRTAIVDQYGKGVGFEQAIERIVNADPDHEALLRAPGKSGAGSATNSGKITPPTETKQMSSLDKIAKGLLNL